MQISLDPDETRYITFTLHKEQLAFTRADGTYGTEPGNFHVWIAPDCLGGLRGEYKIYRMLTRDPPGICYVSCAEKNQLEESVQKVHY